MAKIVEVIEVSQQLRPVEIEIYGKKVHGLFHKWIEVDESKNAAPARTSYGLVEVDNGKIFRIKPLYIRFLDSKDVFENYCFEEDTDVHHDS